MAWANKTETHLNSFPVARSTADAVRIAASETRIYAVYKAINGRLRLAELNADGTVAQVNLGELFTQTTAEIKGLVWDRALGALRALVQNGSRQSLYRVDISDGSASGQIQLPSGSLYAGLTLRNGVLITQGAGNTELFSLTIQGFSVAAARIANKTSPVNGANQRG